MQTDATLDMLRMDALTDQEKDDYLMTRLFALESREATYTPEPLSAICPSKITGHKHTENLADHLAFLPPDYPTREELVATLKLRIERTENMDGSSSEIKEFMATHVNVHWYPEHTTCNQATELVILYQHNIVVDCWRLKKEFEARSGYYATKASECLANPDDPVDEHERDALLEKSAFAKQKVSVLDACISRMHRKVEKVIIEYDNPNGIDSADDASMQPLGAKVSYQNKRSTPLVQWASADTIVADTIPDLATSGFKNPGLLVKWLLKMHEAVLFRRQLMNAVSLPPFIKQTYATKIEDTPDSNEVHLFAETYNYLTIEQIVTVLKAPPIVAHKHLRNHQDGHYNPFGPDSDWSGMTTESKRMCAAVERLERVNEAKTKAATAAAAAAAKVAEASKSRASELAKDIEKTEKEFKERMRNRHAKKRLHEESV